MPEGCYLAASGNNNDSNGVEFLLRLWRPDFHWHHLQITGRNLLPEKLSRAGSCITNIFSILKGVYGRFFYRFISQK